ncbi:hypothetical protein C1890_15100 [Pseudomonas sp. DP16D-R1]|nr:hypothetical protein C1890_15100 [Pseudomonas sp. DP16D-R1]
MDDKTPITVSMAPESLSALLMPLQDEGKTTWVAGVELRSRAIADGCDRQKSPKQAAIARALVDAKQY